MPRTKALTPNAALSARAALPVSSAREPTHAGLEALARHGRRASQLRDVQARPAHPSREVDLASPTETSKRRSATRVLPAVSRRPPRWRIVPAAVAGSMRPPLIGNRNRLPLARAGSIGATATPSEPSACAVPRSSLSVVAPPASRTSAAAVGASTNRTPATRPTPSCLTSSSNPREYVRPIRRPRNFGRSAAPTWRAPAHRARGTGAAFTAAFAIGVGWRPTCSASHSARRRSRWYASGPGCGAPRSGSRRTAGRPRRPSVRSDCGGLPVRP